MRTESQWPTVLLLMLTGIVLLLMVAIIGLFVRMNQLQRAVWEAFTVSRTGAVEEMGLAVGAEAPDFGLSDTDGAEVTLGDFAGRKVLLVFSSISCPACSELYPHLEAFSEVREEVQVVMISRGSAEGNRQLLEEQGFDFPVLAWDDGVIQAYQVPGTPFCYVIEEGVVVNKGFANTQEQLEALIENSAE